MKLHRIKLSLISLFLSACLLFSFVPCAFAETADELYESGLQYLLGDGVEQDLPKGVSMIVEAATLGSPAAMIQVGVMFRSGLGKSLSTEFIEGTEAEVALSWYEKAAEAGDVNAARDAISRDAFMYFLGSEDGSVQEDDATALMYFEKAAEYGDPDALNMMVAFYTYGFGVEQDAEKALELSCRNADQGNEEALLAIEENAYAYYSGNKDGIDINFSTAFQYYLKLTEYDNPRAMYNVGLLYEYGLGVTADHEKAVEWLRKAQDAGYEPAKSMLDQISNNN